MPLNEIGIIQWTARITVYQRAVLPCVHVSVKRADFSAIIVPKSVWEADQMKAKLIGFCGYGK